MGRYFTGDIEGKFWFAVQSSDCADRFGVQGYQPEVLKYWFSEEDLEGVEQEITNIETKLGDKLKIIDDFFASRSSYNDEMLLEIGISKQDLSEYADLGMGKKIRDCIKENGQCEFEAEC
jgi:hypothetical protein